MSIDNSTVANTYNTTNNYYNNDAEIRDANNRATVGTIENLPEGTTDQDVANAISNGVSLVFFDLLKQHIEASDMDNDAKEYMLGELDTLLADNLTEVDPEVQAATDAQFGEQNADIAQDMLDFFMKLANEERSDEARKTDSDGGNSDSAEGGANWLIQLAKALAEVQSMWLEKLMDSYETMRDSTMAEPGKDAEEKDKELYTDSQKAFIQAQAEVTAYARLFGMASEVTSNVLKSVGDGLTSVARKQ